jgi:hypothetical protein
MTAQAVKEIPPEKLGFEGFVLDYALNSNISERNKCIISLFPNDFWKVVEISIDDATKYADVLCQSEAMLPRVVAESKDEYLKKLAPRLYAAYGVMKKITIWNSGLMKEKDFKNKCAEIFRGELQLIGMKMFSILKPEDKKSFLDQVYSSAVPSCALRVWADYVCTPIADYDILSEYKKRDFPSTHLSDIIGKIGLIPTIAWLRELPDYRNFENRVNALSQFLLDSKIIKSYIMFDSVFFPYTNK